MSETNRAFGAAALGLAVKSARERLKITANDLANQAGINASSLCRTEKGTRMLDLDEAARIAPLLDISVQGLVDLAIRLEHSGLAKRQDAAREEFRLAADGAKAAASQISKRKGLNSSLLRAPKAKAHLSVNRYRPKP